MIKLNLMPVFLMLVFLFSCTTHNVYRDINSLFSENVYLPSQVVKYDSVRKKNLLITFPIVTDKFSKVLSADINKEMQNIFCKESGNTTISYEVTHLTNQFLSYIKHVEIECSSLPSDVVYEKGLNYLIYNDSLFNLKFKPSVEESESMVEIIKKTVDPECLIDEKNTLDFEQFIFDEGKLYLVNPLGSKICAQNVEVKIKSFTTFDFMYVKQ